MSGIWGMVFNMGVDTVVAIVGAVIAGISALAAVAQARDARAAAGEATDEAAVARQQADAALRSAVAAEQALSAAREQTEAATRTAQAAERLNELTEAQIPVPTVRWSLELSAQHRYVLRNVGEAVALDVRLVSVDNRIFTSGELERDRVAPDEALTPRLIMTGGVKERVVVVRWYENQRDQAQDRISEKRLAIPG